MPHSDSKFLQFNVANATLTATVFELIGRGQAKLGTNEVMSAQILRVTRQICILLLSHHFSDRLIDLIDWDLLGTYQHTQFIHVRGEVRLGTEVITYLGSRGGSCRLGSVTLAAPSS